MKQEIYPFNKISIRNSKGLTLVETLVAILVLSFILFPLSLSLRSSSKSNIDAEETALSTYYATGKMEEVLAMDFSAIPLSTPTGTPLPPPISDTVTIRGATTNRDVYVDLSDGNGDSIPDVGLKKITVKVRDFSIDTLKADYPYATF